MTDSLTLQQTNIIPGFNSRDGYQLLWSMAKMFSETTLVPEYFRKNIGNCAIAINMANRMGADPLMVMQNMYIVYGNPAWSSKFLIATFNQCGKYSSIKYKMIGTKGSDDYGCIAYAKELATGETLSGSTITIGIAKKEGWYQKNGSKWQTMPEQMLRYRAASNFIRTTAPELSMGLQTVEEEQDFHEKDITPIEKPITEIEHTMASKTLDIPKVEADIKVKQDVLQTSTKKIVENASKSTSRKIQTNNEQEELSEMPAF